MFQKTFFKFIFTYSWFWLLTMACTPSPSDSDDEIKDDLQIEPIQEKLIGSFEQNLIDQGLVNLQKIDSSILVDLRYSTENNFFGKDVYEELESAYLPEDVALKLSGVNKELKRENPNLSLLVFDAVRPLSVQQILWDALDTIPVNQRKAYVADPQAGSLHNYGCAIDLSIFDDLKDSLLDMGTTYDYFGYLAYPRKEEEMLKNGLLTSNQIENRLLLRKAMRAGGFVSIKSEWWHFNCTSLTNAKQKYTLIK
jgi:zinc D-Ala-D-Ala dipeptidase